MNPVNPDTAGNVTGVIMFDGVAPKPEPIRMRSDPNCAGTALTEMVLVGDGGALQNVHASAARTASSTWASRSRA